MEHYNEEYIGINIYILSNYDNLNQQVKLLSSLGIESTLITDGNTPFNLSNTANGLVAIEDGSA